ncbi:flavodoxin family protein [Halobacillus salinarum]|uniref:Flavodoxin family protein n=1 Tax=Halobacillus salinarum TaxID=2932257 RepID=A0ABY4EQG6_9BACI|nr:flavodoxin family protein [Halobacillus salinarum]UOQ46423.1 flavodoxin family protein [Halobacillus salinarum]
MLTLLGSSREEGNTEALVKQIMQGIDYTSITLSHHTIQPISDKRHSIEGFTPVHDDYEKILQEVLSHDILIFATPIYWFGMSGQMKVFIDRWSQYLRDSRYHMKEELSKKTAYVVLTGGTNPKITGLPLIQQFSYIFDFVHMKFEDYIIGEAVKPGEILLDSKALLKAEEWNHNFTASMNNK